MENDKLLNILEKRFKGNVKRHKDIKWDRVKDYLKSNEDILKTLEYMEESGGEPDLIILVESGEAFYADISKESPSERRSISYDKKARVERKKNPPELSAEEISKKFGAQILTADLYKKLQKLEDLDLKTSSWLKTPDTIRSLGGAIFGDKRYKETFIYHNGADSYYKERGVRLKVDLDGLVKEN